MKNWLGKLSFFARINTILKKRRERKKIKKLSKQFHEYFRKHVAWVNGLTVAGLKFTEKNSDP